MIRENFAPEASCPRPTILAKRVLHRDDSDKGDAGGFRASDRTAYRPRLDKGTALSNKAAFYLGGEELGWRVG